MTDKEKAIETILEGSFSFTLNMNDTFGFACADAEDMSVDDFEELIPIIAKYGHYALTAYVAVKRDAEPIHCSCGHDTKPFQDAREEIKAIKDKLDFCK
jgi:hypothetical protein